MRESGDNYFLTEKDIKVAINAYCNSESDVFNPYFSPILHENQTGLLEIIIVTTEYDSLRDQGETYLPTLRESRDKSYWNQGQQNDPWIYKSFRDNSCCENVMTMVFSLAGKRCK